jgi:hypothetical protein
MSPESESDSVADEDRERPDTSSGQLFEQRRAVGLSTCWSACWLVAVVGAAGFVLCGVWQATTIVRGARQALREAVVESAPQTHVNARAPLARGVQTGMSSPTAAPTPRPAAVDAQPMSRVVLTAASNLSAGHSSAATFEAHAEAPAGVDSTDDDHGEVVPDSLTLGLPPPEDFPRVTCEDVFVYIVSIADGSPRRSAATIGIGKKARSQLRRPGEKIGEWTLLAISDDRTGINPGVWLEKDGAVCRAELEGNPARVAPKPKARSFRRRRRGRR